MIHTLQNRHAATGGRDGLPAAGKRPIRGARLLGIVERRGNDAVSLRFTGCNTPSDTRKTGVLLVIILPRIVGALLAPAAPMVQYSIALTGHYITNLLVINTEQLGNGSGSQLLR
jgi:hypothetical protein